MGLKGLSDFLQQFESYTPDSAGEQRSSGSTNKSMQASEVFDFLALVRDWGEIVGPKLAQHTIPIKNSRGVLTILTDHPAYGQELSFLQNPLIAKIEKRFNPLKGKIKRLLFQNDPTFLKTKFSMMAKASGQPAKKPQASARYHPHSPEYKTARREAETAFAHISDEEARQSLVSLFVQMTLGD